MKYCSSTHMIWLINVLCDRVYQIYSSTLVNNSPLRHANWSNSLHLLDTYMQSLIFFQNIFSLRRKMLHLHLSHHTV